MAENSKIEWTDHTANLWWGCQKVHAGCDNCYAETLDNRYNHDAPHWGPHSMRKVVNGVWKDLSRFQRDAAKEGVIKRVFVGSMMDIFEKPFPLVDNKNVPIEGMNTHDLRMQLFTEIVPNSPNLLFLLLTKRPGNIKKYVPQSWLTNAPKNVMYGASMVSPETLMVDELLSVPGRHFISAEPLLAPIQIPRLSEIDWVIVGGESGHGARPMQAEWAVDIKEQCCKNSTLFFFKQNSQANWLDFKNFSSFPESLQLRELPAS